MTYFITTNNPTRRQVWRRLFASDRLPVKHPKPRRQHVTPGRSAVLAYDLDSDALHPQALARLAAYVTRRTDVAYRDARAMVADGWPIPAVGCTVVGEASWVPTPAGETVGDAASA